jgi:hypothetical protein
MSTELFDQRQHFIPRFYLNGFTEGNSGFFYECMVKEAKSIRKVHTKNVCYSMNFYDVHDTAIREMYRIDDIRYLESSFNYENELPAILKRIGNVYSVLDQNNFVLLDRKEFNTIVDAYLGIKHRTPYHRKKVGGLHTEGKIFDEAATSVKNEAAEFMKSYDFDFDSFIKKYKEEFLSDKELPKKQHLASLIQTSLGANEAVRDAEFRLLSMNVTVVQALPNDYFFVSDNPGYSLDGNRMFNTNYGKFDTIHFPISSKQLISLNGFDWRNHFKQLIRPQVLTADSRFVEEVNKMTTLICNEKIFCESKEYLERFIVSNTSFVNSASKNTTTKTHFYKKPH